jgi:CheY-like chemotaxis protein
MSHEIRTPLTAILGFTELLKEEGDSGLSRGERLNTLDTITVAGNHLLTIINDILDLSKIEADRTTIERVDTSLMALLFEIEGLNSKRAIGKGVSLELQLATAVPDRILTDPTRLRQILMNLVGNAIKFTEQGSVIVSVRELDFNGKYALAIDVKDTGRGMSQDQVERLFQPFAQADNTVTRTHGGTGLGLNISRRLAQLMEGDVFLMQTEIGKGSCFRLMLPIELSQGAVRVEHIDKSRPIPPVEVEQPPCKLSGRILLAEDGVDNQKLISFHLTKAGASVSIASNGQIALQMMQDANQQGRPFDLLLTDISMPELDGYELVRRLRAMGCKIPVVALTAHALAEDRDRCLEAGCDDYQSKPIVKRDLLETCKRWLLEKPS